MRRLLAALALAVLLPGAAFAQGNAARDLLLFGSNQRAVASLNFVSGAYTLNGQTYPSFQAMPGASFTRASSKTCQTLVQVALGTFTTVGSGVPCQTDQGLSIEELRTNSFLNNASPVTQSVTTTATSWTLSIYGAGSIVMSGNCSGTLNGLGGALRATLTATCTAGATTLTVSGSPVCAQFEAGGFATSCIVTAGSAATRAADVASISGNLIGPGNWTVVAKAQGIAVQAANFPTLWSSGSGTGAQVLVFASSGGPSVSAAENVSGPIFTGVLSSTGVSGGATKTALTLNGSAVRGSALGQAAAAIGAWTAITSTQLGLGGKFDGSQPLNGYFQSLVVQQAGSTDAQIQAAGQ